MSLRATAWAWTVAVQPTAKLVLVALADHADEIGLCWPSVAALVEKTGLSERAVRSNIAILEASGLVTVERGDGRGHSSRYRLRINQAAAKGAPPAPNSTQKGADDAPNSDGERVQQMPERVHLVPERVHVVPERVQQVHPEPSRTVKNHQEPSVSARGARLPADWWPAPPDQTFARDLGLDPTAIADSFRDYWHGRTGAGATKLDWSATWRNWCRRDAERRPKARQPESKTAWALNHPMFNGGRHAEPDRDSGPVAPLPAPPRLRSV